MGLSLRFGLTVLACASATQASVIGTQTITNATHYGYYQFASTSAQNTKALINPINGTARVIRITGNVTKVHEDAWLSSIQVQPYGFAVASYQPWIEFSDQRDFEGTVEVKATVWIPGGGLSMSGGLNLEMFSLDAEQYVPGVDARSTLTYEFDNAYPAGTATYSGALTTSDARFNRPAQYYYTNGFGQIIWRDPELTGAFPYYDVQPFHVAEPGQYSMVSANEFESSSVLYAGNFDPNNPLANAVMARNQSGNVIRNRNLNGLPINDDAVGATMIEAQLQPGVQYYFVTTAFNYPGVEPDGGPFIGRYNNLISGSGVVTLGLIPEPASALLLLSAGMAARRARRV
jgi:hypothetical protein